jgi:hypothetical protein
MSILVNQMYRSSVKCTDRVVNMPGIKLTIGNPFNESGNLTLDYYTRKICLNARKASLAIKTRTQSGDSSLAKCEKS